MTERTLPISPTGARAAAGHGPAAESRSPGWRIGVFNSTDLFVLGIP